MQEEIVNEKNSFIFNYLTKNRFILSEYDEYIKNNIDNIDEIYDILISDVSPKTDIGNLFKGIRYYCEQQYENMKIYYMSAIKLDNVIAMLNLARYYQHVEKNYKLMSKYYLMAINNENAAAMNGLAFYYQYYSSTKYYDLMKKYYLMAIELKNVKAMYNLGRYYQDIEQQYDLMKGYYLTAIDHQSKEAMNALGYYFQTIEKNYFMMSNYYLMAIKLQYSPAMINFAGYYQDIEKDYNEMLKYYVMAINLHDKNALSGLVCFFGRKEHTLYHVLVEYTDSHITKEILNTIEQNPNFQNLEHLEKYDKKCTGCLEETPCIKFMVDPEDQFICMDCYLAMAI